MSNDELIGTNQFVCDPVYLGFAEDVTDSNRFRLRSHFMPLGKIGGKPSWLSYRPLPTAADLTCSNCQKTMCFLLQMYATRPHDPEHAFHRALFVFVCREPSCSQTNVASNFKVFRCQLPRVNEFYRSDRAYDPDVDGDVEPDEPVEKFTQLCEMCGCEATKKCARCELRWYCSKEHQAAHWKLAHKAECAVEGLKARVEFDNPIVFPEFGIGIDLEERDIEDFDDSDDDCNAAEDEDEGTEAARMAEYRRFLVEQQQQPTGGIDDTDVDEIEETNRDVRFKRFNRIIQENPDQILRYQRGGEPLWATDTAPVPTSIPDCELCGASRQFEAQLTSRLLPLIGVDAVGLSIDWATVAVFTCSASCAIPDHGYAPEFVVKQDFQ